MKVAKFSFFILVQTTVETGGHSFCIEMYVFSKNETNLPLN